MKFLPGHQLCRFYIQLLLAYHIPELVMLTVENENASDFIIPLPPLH